VNNILVVIVYQLIYSKEKHSQDWLLISVFDKTEEISKTQVDTLQTSYP
jgi:hypothetical protein